LLTVQIFYVDFGNTETLSTTSLRADPICADVPAQAFNCVLDGIQWVCCSVNYWLCTNSASDTMCIHCVRKKKCNQ